MSKYNLELRERKEVIIVKKIIQKIDEHVADFPAMRIRDQNDREHLLTAVDFPNFKWKKIKNGSVLVVNLKEQIQSVRLKND